MSEQNPDTKKHGYPHSDSMPTGNKAHPCANGKHSLQVLAEATA